MDLFDPAKDMRVVVACEDSTAAARASVVLERIGGEGEGQGRGHYCWWNYEILAIPSLKKVAALEAAAADMIAFAAHDGSELPEDVVDWISMWLAMGDFRSRALVAILDSDTAGNGNSQSILSQLNKVAELGQMDFFATCAHSQPDGVGRYVVKKADRTNPTAKQT